MVIWFIGLTLIALFALFCRHRIVSSSMSPQKGSFNLPSDIALHAQPLLNERALSLYNLMRLAVQDHYLVFAQVPLWSIIDVRGERKARSRILRRIALKRLDFVLVHPGSRVVQHVVQVEEDASIEESERDRQEAIRSFVEAAGISYRSLHPQVVYTVPQIAALLGVGEEEQV